MAALPHRARARTDAEEVTSGRALRFGGVPAACVLLALAFRDGIGVPLLLLGAVISAGAAWVTTVGARVRPPREQLAWRWFRRASWAVVLGFSLEVLVVALTGGVATPGSSGAFAAGTTAVVAMLYQAVQHWNRTRTDDEDSGEWLAGLGAAFAAAAVLMYVASRGPGPHASGWHADGHALRAAVVVVLLCTVVTIIPTANLLPDWRAWTLVGLVTVVVGFELVSYVAVVTGGGHHDHQMAGVVCGWVVLTLMIAFASTTAPVVRRRADVSPTASTVGAIVVVVVAVATIVVDALAPSGRADVALLSALGALAGTLRLAYMVRDYAELSVAQRESRTDGLTGVPNRRAFIERLERRLSRHREVSLMMIDLDEFKAVNDDRGHAAGDELMRTVAARMAAALTADGMLARIGGDEFAVLLDGHDHELAQRTARSVLEAVRTPVMIDGEPVRIDASSAWSAHAIAARPSRSCCAPRTTRCTRPSARVWASRSSTSGSRPTRTAAWGCCGTCARCSPRRRGPPASSSCTTSRRSRARTGPSWGSRRSSGGSTRGSACWPLRSSSTSRSATS